MARQREYVAGCPTASLHPKRSTLGGYRGPMLSTAVAGLLTGMSLIVAIGAQNAFVLRQGVRREHVAVVVAICAVSDLLLIAAGTLGIGTIVTKAPTVLTVLRWGGVAYLLWFAFTSFRNAWRPGELHESAEHGKSVGAVAMTALALTYLNPHVYLDTVLMLGNLANQHGNQRWWFAGGAGLGSVMWFTALGFGARALAGPLGKPGTWRVIDATIGVVMVAMAAKLALG